MKSSTKTFSIIIPLALLTVIAFLVWLGWWAKEPNPSFAERVSNTNQGPSFEVLVGVPRLGRPLGGILPDWVVTRMDGTPSELRFDHTNPGAHIVSARPNRVELKADDWDFFIETDAEGRITSGTRLVFPLSLGGRHVKLNCRPAEPANGTLRTNTRSGSEEMVGQFIVELASCKDAQSGKGIKWPPAPLTVRGGFVGQSQGPSPKPEGDAPKT